MMGEWRSRISEHKQLIRLGIIIVQFFVIIFILGKWMMGTYLSANNHEIDPNLLVGSLVPSSSELVSVSDMVETEETTKKWMVDIKGEVQFPGIYEVDQDMRINDVIFMAGGLSSDADIGSLNLAQLVQDQMVIHVFHQKDQMIDEETLVVQTPVMETNKENLININTAPSADLQQLNGIGEMKAEKIISYREENGLFKSIEELMEVSGIGEKTFETIKDKVTVSP
ncbi:helix-hairpin-helix domain-containing protein [Jeotgalibaca sp. MA1X17-3]|uniref:helix-hairpin-helix domain-containing protein n=1 Tax=Jeotgalibaca sp. MA1X17-3 TaxID=2908211 RepID=UPI001F384605|nr:helix-hairpin-helix domain-containing protein [Jeotgalibaca sp. MA1X17-3]UJF14967.1 helix-hairpin-helix domain-containing protein [Jeotgalibaca sp. MA1X17-3]